MDNTVSQRVKDFLAKHEKVGILIGKNPSFDQMAASLSLSLALQQVGKQVTVACPTEPIVANSSLVGIDTVKTQLVGEEGDLIVSFPYREGEIEKVSYTLEQGYLNIVVKATQEGISFSKQDVLFKRSGGLPSLLFIIGTARLSDLGDLFDADSLKNTVVINMDNHSDNQGFGDVVLVSPNASSLSELVGSLLESLQIEQDLDIAQNILSGILQATDNLQSEVTTYMAFETVGVCMRKGAKRIQTFSVKQPEKQNNPFGPFTVPQPKQPMVQRNELSAPKQRPWEQRGQQPRIQQSVKQHVGSQQQIQSQPTTSQFSSQPMQKIEHKEEKEDTETPPDWLAPKVYKSSTLI